MAFKKIVTKRNLLIIAIVLGVASVVTGILASVRAASNTVFYAGFESSDVQQPTYRDAIDFSYNVVGYRQDLQPEASIRQEQRHSGTGALLYSGTDTSENASFVFFKAYDVNIPITADTSLSYWIRPDSANGRCVGIDLRLTDGTTLRDSAAVDQNGTSMHPKKCHGNIRTGEWSHISSDIGKWLAGRTIDRIWVAYEQPQNTGQFKGYIDDIRLVRTDFISSPTSGDYSASYWNYGGEASPAMPERSADITRPESNVNFDWGYQSPGGSVGGDRFIARWTKYRMFEAGTYRFTATADDGIRIYLDGKPVIDKWYDTAVQTYTADVTVTAGEHSLRVEYYERGGHAVVKFDVAKTLLAAPDPTAGYTASYWNYGGESSPAMPTRSADLIRAEAQINSDWGFQSPGANIRGDNFIARWQKKDTFEQGTYRFTATADDGVRVYLDNKPVIDKWYDSAVKTYAADVPVTAGTHDIRVEYYEKGGHAVSKFNLQNISQSAPVASPTAPAPTPTPAPIAAPNTNPFYGTALYVDSNHNPAKAQADAWRASRPADAAQMDKIASNSRGIWMGGWSGNIQTATNNVVSAASAARSMAVLVAYNIPYRDCGSHSAGGLSTSEQYLEWIRGMANGINGRKTVVILEPDAVALTNCLSATDQTIRYNTLSEAVKILTAKGGVVYIDAGHASWVPPAEMAERLRRAGIDHARGFAINVSNFIDTAKNTSYGNDISSRISGKHFVVDTSRNGQGANGEWCNPSGRGLGQKPAIGSGNLDAYLWVKFPGESDGACNGGPNAGQWWSDYALGLAQRSAF